ncbi:MAG: N-acetylneuraminate synthase family protein, partial [Fibrobacterota bacterium]
MTEKTVFIFEMANNHSGDVDHGLQIIDEMAAVSREFPFDCAFKFQYRDLDTFIHPDYADRMDLKPVKRFTETRLSRQEFRTLLDRVRSHGMTALCTPFDETSVDRIVEDGFDFIKIASCSFGDWPLLEKIATTNLPIIASTAGVDLETIDNVVAFFKHRRKELSLMHCVGAYPTAPGDLNLNQIDLLRSRYPELTIGFSTHEEPDNTDAVKIAVAKGARIFERHVAIDTGTYPVNGYSSRPEQIRAWLASAQQALAMCGVEGSRHPISDKEQADLQKLKRGVYLKDPVKAGEVVGEENCYFAIPNMPGQIVANDLSKYTRFTARTPIDADAPLMTEHTEITYLRDDILQIIKQLKEIILESRVTLTNEVDLEISHQYGLKEFYRHGAAILKCINREYCKKLIILLPEQKHPVHHHKKKEETFHLLYGDMTVILDGTERRLTAGDIITVPRNVPHSFSSEKGAVFEEISTTH